MTIAERATIVDASNGRMVCTPDLVREIRTRAEAEEFRRLEAAGAY